MRTWLARDEASYVEFVRTRSGALYRLAMLLTGGDHHLAEDLLQAALAKAYVSWRRVREPAAAEAYVRRILVNVAVSRSRSASTNEMPTEVLPDVAGRDATDVADRLDLWELLRELSPRQRAVVALRYYEDLSEAQNAEVLECSPGAVKSHASRGLAQLRRLLASQNDQLPDRR